VRATMMKNNTPIDVRALRFALLRLNIYYVHIFFIKRVKDIFFSFYIESRWTRKSYSIVETQL
jgi:hypothetical protein